MPQPKYLLIAFACFIVVSSFSQSQCRGDTITIQARPSTIGEPFESGESVYLIVRPLEGRAIAVFSDSTVSPPQPTVRSSANDDKVVIPSDIKSVSNSSDLITITFTITRASVIAARTDNQKQPVVMLELGRQRNGIRGEITAVVQSVFINSDEDPRQQAFSVGVPKSRADIYRSGPEMGCNCEPDWSICQPCVTPFVAPRRFGRWCHCR